eukprot:GHVT01074119.1.p1 GENE.GHVT01074119.1~~GHVT01074119.1.p1  ORF type:complete len:411 (+),score=113.33 GHVT01074119.1:241-1473(+)
MAVDTSDRCQCACCSSSNCACTAAACRCTGCACSAGAGADSSSWCSAASGSSGDGTAPHPFPAASPLAPASSLPPCCGAAAAAAGVSTGSYALKCGLAHMLSGSVIMDVTSVQEAKIAEAAGAAAVMALETVPADIRKFGGVARMTDPALILDIKRAVSIPVMAKCRLGHFVEAAILQAAGVDFIDESEVLTPADEVMHINKHQLSIPTVAGCRNLPEALRRIAEGAVLIRTKGEAGTGNVVEAVRHMRQLSEVIAQLRKAPAAFVANFAREARVPVDLVKEVAQLNRLPVITFAAGGIATPADAALCMHLGMDGVFVGSGIFKAENPAKVARAIVQAVVHYKDPVRLLEVSCGLGKPMAGIGPEALKSSWAGREAAPSAADSSLADPNQKREECGGAQPQRPPASVLTA